MRLAPANRPMEALPVLLALVAAVLVPTAAVVWFMNQAVSTQRNLARQRQTESYREQLVLAREQLDSIWEKRAAELGAQTASASAASAFARCVRAGLTDSAVIVDSSGALAYPAPDPIPAPDPLEWNPPWLAAQALEISGKRLEAAQAYARIAATDKEGATIARALQAQVRCLARSGKTAQAAGIAIQRFSGSALTRAIDPIGRSIAADELLLAARFRAARSSTATGALAALLNDYNAPLPSSQRRFLMDEVSAIDAKIALPTHNAESLAARFAAGYRAPPSEGVLQASAIPGIWTFLAPGSRVVALYSTATIQSSLPKPAGTGVRFSLLPPHDNVVGADQLLPTGAHLAGWQLTLTASPTASDEFGHKESVVYLWIGALAVICATLAGLYALQSFNRQWRVARLKTDLAAAVSHELKTPLAGMRLLVDTLLDEDVFDPVKTREYLDLIARENARLSRLIESFLTYSRLERNRQNFDFQSTDPAAVVRSAVDAVRERFQSAACALDIETAPGLPSIRADEDALTTALINLLDNACKYSPVDKHVTLRVSAADGAVVFEVADRGIGIAAGEIKKIFRRFYQIDRRLARDSGGVGLGLSIVDSIVRAHGGSVEVRSQPGRGSTFLVSLPTRETPRKAFAVEDHAA